MSGRREKQYKAQERCLYKARMLYAIMILCAVMLSACDARDVEQEPVIYKDMSGLSPENFTTIASADDPSAWNLRLVNPWNKLPDGFTIVLARLENGHAIDVRAYWDTLEMLEAARAEGLSPYICSSFRTLEKQQSLYDNKVRTLANQGYTQANAEKEAARWVAFPGTSEHQCGLALDIVAASYKKLDQNQENTAEQKWLMQNSYKYGFILRYSSDKSDITGIAYEPWHYRYVGKAAAKAIYEAGICFEEYLLTLK